MSRRRAMFTLAALCFLAGIVLMRFHLQKAPTELSAASMHQEPRLMLWAWETPEDLTTLDPRRAGVAFLAREVLLSHDVVVRPRHQPLQVTPGTWLVAVVRLETAPGFVPSADFAFRYAKAIAEAATLPNVRALQVDFDATASQRDFYLALLHQLRAALPAGIPLSITALVSWCGPHSWLHGLDIGEAVPMFFRMGGPAASRASEPRSQSVIAEPLCSGSVGLSTDEAWPALHQNQRVYLFRPGPWTQMDLERINSFGYEGLRGSVSP